ncbi:endonuclease/exonuclease/phosphatase family protein [Oligoflexus tunisiensis]|uniref:endonuclease/exonuclease/phosphatase family protein n=1 Tax=Oligoflexus tunisiensis TaxID=708132 RepID=UPI00114CD258|nr:endonuclease/exonuclease/phosphatase family protein [Oligoflexus tunisiensis]
MIRQHLTGAMVLGFSALLSMGGAAPQDSFTVMTWNLYVGADTAPILASPSMQEMASRADAAWRTMESTRFEERVIAIADQIAAHRPHLIGLQEVSLLRVQSPGDRMEGGMEPATTVVYDFEKTLMSELASRGLDYRVVSRVQNADVEVPRANETRDDVRLTDHDLILARGDVEAEPALKGNYQAALSLPFPDGKSNLTVNRGYTLVNVNLLGQEAVFVNSHLEISALEPLQAMQAKELMTILGSRSEPILLVGDFNSRPEGGASYDLMMQSGYRDVWNDRIGPEELGLTCCQAADLSNKDSNLVERIDLVLTRNDSDWLSQEVQAWVVGNQPEDQTSGGLWPSDHAGVVVQFSVK